MYGFAREEKHFSIRRLGNIHEGELHLSARSLNKKESDPFSLQEILIYESGYSLADSITLFFKLLLLPVLSSFQYLAETQ